MSTTATVEPPQVSTGTKALNNMLWVVQVLLAAMFVLTGLLKLTLPAEKLPALMPWTADAHLGFVRFVGIAEVAGGIGLVVPAWLRIKPNLTAWAATGIAAVMVLSVPVHIMRGETSSLGLNALLLVSALFVGWGRFKKAPIEPK